MYQPNRKGKKMSQKTKFIHAIFDYLPIEEKCTWPGTTWRDDPEHKGRQILNDCGADTIGAGIFCDPHHAYCGYHSVCQRHKGTVPFWKQDEQKGGEDE
jgi:hypothetical protein